MKARENLIKIEIFFFSYIMPKLKAWNGMNNIRLREKQASFLKPLYIGKVTDIYFEIILKL